MQAWRDIVLAMLALCVSGVVVASEVGSDRPGAAGPMEQTYQAEWRERPSTAITRALAPSFIRACTTYKYKRNSAKPHEYLVRCSRDGRSWQSYLIYTDTGTVVGPYAPAAAYD